MRKALKVTTLLVFFTFFFGLFYYYHFIETPPSVTAGLYEEEYLEDMEEEVLESRLTFDKDIVFVYVGELNNFAVAGIPYGDIGKRRVSFNEETKAAYFYEQFLTPSQYDGIFVIQESNSMDILMKQDIYKGNDQVRFRLYPLNQPADENFYMIINEGRMFLNSDIEITKVNDQGDISVVVNEETRTLKPGESFVLRKTEENTELPFKSVLAITNYGLWNSKNIKYVVTNY